MDQDAELLQQNKVKFPCKVVRNFTNTLVQNPVIYAWVPVSASHGCGFCSIRLCQGDHAHVLIVVDGNVECGNRLYECCHNVGDWEQQNRQMHHFQHSAYNHHECFNKLQMFCTHVKPIHIYHNNLEIMITGDVSGSALLLWRQYTYCAAIVGSNHCFQTIGAYKNYWSPITI